jgi:hypothetical protein
LVGLFDAEAVNLTHLPPAVNASSHGTRRPPRLQLPAVAVHAAALVGLSVLIFAGVIFSADSFPADFSGAYYTLPAYWIASLTAGEWPSWIPYVGMGMPLGAIPQSGILYPPFWIFPALHLPYTLKAASILQVLHVSAGAIGGYVLARRLFASPGVALVAATAYLVYGGFYVNAEHADIVRGFALLPWLCWALVLPPDRLRMVRAGPCVWLSALAVPNLTLPAFTLLLVTGAYPGQVEALAAIVPILVAVQLIRNARDGQLFLGALLDAAVVVLLLGLGFLLASAFLFPLAAAWDELTRTSGGVLPPSSLIYLHPRDLYGLVLSSNFVRPDLHRDIGMQLPLALFPFALFIRRRTAWLLLPFYAIAAFALVMSLDVLTQVSRAVIGVVPLLGYSRFPAGDYRTFFALAVLLTLAGGLRDALATRRRGPRVAARYLLGLGGLGLVLATAFVPVSDVPTKALAGAQTVLTWQIVPAIVLGFGLLLAGRHIVRPYLPIAAAGLCVLSAWPVLADMRDDWQVHDAERWLLDDADMKLWDAGAWQVDRVFQQQPLVARPVRNAIRKYPTEVSWNGYLKGEFLMRGDSGGAVLPARRVVERQPELMAFMREASRLIALPCMGSGACANGPDVHIPVASGMVSTLPGFAWQPVTHSRSSIQYHVVLPEPGVVIENELFSRGWRATIDGPASVQPVRVNDALRGWVLPAGEYELDLVFEQPWFAVGVAVSVAAALVYALVLAGVARKPGQRVVRILSSSPLNKKTLTVA